MGIERIGQIKAFEHGIAISKVMFGAERGSYGHVPDIDRDDAGLVGIDQSALVVGLGPQDTVAGMKGERLGIEQAQRKSVDREVFDAVEEFISTYIDAQGNQVNAWSDLENNLANFDTDQIIDCSDNFLPSYGADEWSDAGHHDHE